ncbi:MAG: hypothetical protein AVDCRST_MAG64-2768, partial [uncultured Phycisphaerae bacterium]
PGAVYSERARDGRCRRPWHGRLAHARGRETRKRREFQPIPRPVSGHGRDAHATL